MPRPRGDLHAAAPAIVAAGVLAVSQVLDQNSAALLHYAGAVTSRLEEPLELVAAFLVTIALVMKIGMRARPGTGSPGAQDREARRGAR